jgi:SAM-dependent methyltransferase
MRPLPAASAADDAEILRELAGLSHRDGTLAQFPSLAGGHQYLRLYRLVRRHVRPGAEVLDWGMGNGHFSYFLLRAGYRASGYSLEASAPPPWLEREGFAFAAGSAADPVTIPFASGSFDAVASVGVLEHVRDTGGDEAASLREIHRVLRPGGMFICYHLPNRTSAIEAVARALPVHSHMHRYVRDDIARLVAGAGLELVDTARYAILPRNPLRRLPEAARRSEGLARAYDAADELLGRLLSPLCTNHYVVARRPATGRGSVSGRA